MAKTVVAKHFDEIAKDYDFYTQKRSYHYSALKKLLRSLIPAGKKVLEVGCGTGDLLDFINPRLGYGMDISGEMVGKARIKHKKNRNLIFSTKWPNGKFEYVFMSDVIEHLEKPDETFRQISNRMDRNTIFVCTMMNLLWIPIEIIYEWLGLKMPEGKHKRISFKKIKHLLEEAGLRVKKRSFVLLMPIKIPFISDFVNKYLEKPFRRFAFIEYIVAVKA